MKYIIVEQKDSGPALHFQASAFNKGLFQRRLQQLGVQVSLASPAFDNGTFKILPYIDNTPAFDPRFERHGAKTETIYQDRVECIYSITQAPLDEFKNNRIDEVYDKAAWLLDAQAGRRSVVEIADWPLLKIDIKQYQADGSIGSMLQTAVDRSNYDAAGLVAAFASRIDYENSVIIKRSQHTAAINALTTHIDVENYDIEIGWPAII